MVGRFLLDLKYPNNPLQHMHCCNDRKLPEIFSTVELFQNKIKSRIVKLKSNPGNRVVINPGRAEVVMNKEYLTCICIRNILFNKGIL